MRQILVEIGDEKKKEFRISKEGLEALQNCTEMYLVSLFQDMAVMAYHRKGKTILPWDRKNIALLNRYHGEFKLSNDSEKK